MRPLRKLVIKLLLILAGWSTSLVADNVGNTDTANGRLDSWFSDVLVESPITAAELTQQFNVDSAFVYCEGSSTSRKVKITLYADNSGNPGDSIASSTEITLINGVSRTWYSIPVDWILNASTPYWIGAIADGAANLSKTIVGSGKGMWRDTAAVYATLPADGSTAIKEIDEDTLKAACLYFSGTFGSGPTPSASPRRKMLLTGVTP